MAEINAIKYFNAVNATLFRRDRVEDGESWGIVGRKVSIKEAKWRNNCQNKVVCSICQAELSDHRSSTFSCVYQSECARMRPVIGLVVPLKVQSANQRRGSRGGQKQPVLSAAPERGRREDMEIHIAAVFSIVNHLYIILWYIICLKWLLVNL